MSRDLASQWPAVHTQKKEIISVQNQNKQRLNETEAARRDDAREGVWEERFIEMLPLDSYLTILPV